MCPYGTPLLGRSITHFSVRHCKYCRRWLCLFTACICCLWASKPNGSVGLTASSSKTTLYTTTSSVAAAAQQYCSDIMPVTRPGWRAVALLLALFPLSSSSFITSPLRGPTAWHHQPQGTCSRLFMANEPSTSTSTPSSRRAFLERGAVAASWGLVAASLAPARSLATDFAGIDVRGIDVSEILHPGVGGGGGKASRPLRDCLLNVERVRISTKQLEDTLTNDGAPPGLTALVKGLVKNYKLDESLQQGALYIESQGDRNAAASAGREALEYLAQTAEYFPAQVDDRTGATKTMNAEALEFTVNALGATRGKLEVFLSKVPSDALREARAEIKAEGGGGQT